MSPPLSMARWISSTKATESTSVRTASDPLDASASFCFCHRGKPSSGYPIASPAAGVDGSRISSTERSGVAVRVFQLDLLAAGALLDLVAGAETGLLHRLDVCRQVIDLEDDPVPPARLLLAAIGQGPGPRTLRAAQPESGAPVRDACEGHARAELLLHLEAQVLRIEPTDRSTSLT